MQNIIITFVFLFCFHFGFSQSMTISTKEVADCVWDQNKNEYIGKSKDYVSFFEFNDNNTMITHTNYSGVSGYLIQHYGMIDYGERKVLTYMVVNDFGREVEIVVDVEKGELKLFYKINDERHLEIYTINSVWGNDE